MRRVETQGLAALRHHCTAARRIPVTTQRVGTRENEYGVQIMSPHFETQPDEAVVVPKSDWRKPPSRL